MSENNYFSVPDKDALTKVNNNFGNTVKKEVNDSRADAENNTQVEESASSERLHGFNNYASNDGASGTTSTIPQAPSAATNTNIYHNVNQPNNVTNTVNYQANTSNVQSNSFSYENNYGNTNVPPVNNSPMYSNSTDNQSFTNSQINKDRVANKNLSFINMRIVLVIAEIFIILGCILPVANYKAERVYRKSEYYNEDFDDIYDDMLDDYSDGAVSEFDGKHLNVFSDFPPLAVGFIIVAGVQFVLLFAIKNKKADIASIIVSGFNVFFIFIYMVILEMMKSERAVIVKMRAWDIGFYLLVIGSLASVVASILNVINSSKKTG